MRLTASECSMSAGPRLLGSPRFVRQALFPCPLGYSPTDRPPESYDPGFILRFGRLFRVPSSRSRRIAFPRRLSLPGFGPSSRHHRTRPHPRGLPGPRFVPSSGALSLPTAFSARDFGAYCIPEPRPGLLSFRGFSPRTATLPHRKELPPCRWCLAHSPNVVRCPWTRSSATRSFSARSRVPLRRCLAGRSGRSPLRVFLSSRLPFSPFPSVTRGTPLLSFSAVPSLARSSGRVLFSVS